MRLTFLGTGTSFGVPVVGCDCETCSSDDPRDRRTRHGALLEMDGGTLLVDTPPELRLQLLANRITDVDAVWFTHVHADHVHGIDDLRIFTVRGGPSLRGYVAADHVELLTNYFRYIFDESVQPAAGSSKPRAELVPYEGGRPVEVLGESVLPVRVPHGPMDVFGFRVGSLGYVTDAKTLPAEAVDALRGVDVLVLNALWWGRSHAAHLTIDEAIEASRAVGARRTYLTHLTHRVTQAQLDRQLPDGVFGAYDGLSIEIDHG
ncbi:MAG: MBL fold metallo-hydrolase [Longimicrobiales bacterium]